MKEIAKLLGDICAAEEIKARQSSKDRDILEGDRDITYFQAVANQRARKKIDVIEGYLGLVEDDKEIMEIVVPVLKDLFSYESRGNISL